MKHIASCGLFGPYTGSRVGTQYANSFEDVGKIISKSTFRFRNVGCRGEYYAWLKAQPIADLSGPDGVADGAPWWADQDHE